MSEEHDGRSLFLMLTEDQAQVNIKRDPLITREQCGKSWDSLDLSTIRPVDPFIWSISGGAEYRKHATDILKRWEPNDLVNVVVIAMDQETADHLCQSGYESVVFDRPLNSYSKVADAKFQVSRELSNAVHQLPFHRAGHFLSGIAPPRLDGAQRTKQYARYRCSWTQQQQWLYKHWHVLCSSVSSSHAFFRTTG